ncbi:hypothetical protein FB107DRAFT_280431 [Schizophyllum commune]
MSSALSRVGVESAVECRSRARESESYPPSKTEAVGLEAVPVVRFLYFLQDPQRRDSRHFRLSHRQSRLSRASAALTVLLEGAPLINISVLVLAAFTQRTPTDISVNLDIVLEPNRPPRSSTSTGRIAKRGSDLGAASPCLVPRRALISPRRVPPPRDVGADAHASTESSASTSELGVCRRGWRVRRRERQTTRLLRRVGQYRTTSRLTPTHAPRSGALTERGMGETHMSNSLRPPCSLLKTPSTIPPRTCDDADTPLDGTSKPVGGILSKCVQRTSHDAGSLSRDRAEDQRRDSRTSTSTATMLK